MLTDAASPPVSVVDIMTGADGKIAPDTTVTFGQGETVGRVFLYVGAKGKEARLLFDRRELRGKGRNLAAVKELWLIVTSNLK